MFGSQPFTPNYAQESSGFSSMSPFDGTGLSQSQVNDIIKALTSSYDRPPTTGGGTLIPESLDATMKVLEFREGHLKLWKQINKTPAASVIEQYNVLTSYGPGNGYSVRFGETGPETASEYVRKVLFLKAKSVTRAVTDEMTLVNSQPGSVIALETKNAILDILRDVEKDLFYADSTLAFNGQSEQWDGLDSLIQSDMTLDLENAPLQEAVVETAANLLVEHYAEPNKFFLNTKAMSDLNKTMYPRERYNLPAPTNGQIGINVEKISTSAGILDFEPSIFVKKASSPSAVATSVNAPATPQAIASIAMGTAGTSDWTKLGVSLVPGLTFGYAVCAGNRHGLSAPVINIAVEGTVTGAALAAGQSLNFNITNAAVIGSQAPEFFVVYRTNVLANTVNAAPTDLSQYSEIFRVRCTAQGAGVTGASVVDRNIFLPFTSKAFMGQMTPDVLTWRQLAPLRKINLALTSPAYRWMLLLYGAVALFAPAKWCRLINIGDLT